MIYPQPPGTRPRRPSWNMRMDQHTRAGAHGSAHRGGECIGRLGVLPAGPPRVYKAMEICYNDAAVACASRTAATCLEESIATTDRKESLHENHYPQYSPRGTSHKSAVHGRGEPSAD